MVLKKIMWTSVEVSLRLNFFEIELALKLANGDNVVEARRLWPTNRSVFKQISVKLNGT